MRALARAEAAADDASGSASAAANDGDATIGPIQTAAVSTDPAQVGQWTPKFNIPGIAVHAVMLHTGKILYFTGTTSGRAFLLDPVTKTTRAVYPPKIPGGEDEPANLFCAGQSFLDDGTVIVMGGDGAAARRPQDHLPVRPGDRDVAQGANMQHGRWYPTQVLLADGRTGRDGRPRRARRAARQLPDRELQPGPRLRHAAERSRAGGPSPGGRPVPAHVPECRAVACWWPDRPSPATTGSSASASIGALSWEDAPNPVRHTWGSGVLLPGTPSGSTRVALIGGVDRDSLPDTGTSTPLPVVQTFDEANPSAGWATAPGLNTDARITTRCCCPTARWSPWEAATGSSTATGGRATRRSTATSRSTIPRAGSGRSDPRRTSCGPTTPPRCCCPTRACCPPGTTGTAAASTTPLRYTAAILVPRRPADDRVGAGLDRVRRVTSRWTPRPMHQGGADGPRAVTHANDMSQRNVPLTATAGPGGTS